MYTFRVLSFWDCSYNVILLYGMERYIRVTCIRMFVIGMYKVIRIVHTLFLCTSVLYSGYLLLYLSGMIPGMCILSFKKTKLRNITIL